MPRPDGRIEPGQPLKGAISARAWNRAQDAADRVLGVRTDAEASAGPASLKPYTWCYAQNNTSGDVPQWGVMQINDMRIPPVGTSSQEGNESQFIEMPVLNCGTPSTEASSSLRRPYWCVAVEPISRFGVGRVAVSGVVQAKVNITDLNVFCVRPQPNTTRLMTSSIGHARILWKEPGDFGLKWALIELGSISHVVLDGTYSGRWAKDATKTVYVMSQSLQSGAFYEEYSVVNRLYDVVPGDNGGSCTLWSSNGVKAELMSFDLSTLRGYSASSPVALGVSGGGVQWLPSAPSNSTTGKTLLFS